MAAELIPGRRAVLHIPADLAEDLRGDPDECIHITVKELREDGTVRVGFADGREAWVAREAVSMNQVGVAEEIPDGANARVGMFSARWDRGPTETLFRGVYHILKKKNYPVLMVDEAARDSVGGMTLPYLSKLIREKGVLLAVCTSDYAEKTDSRYSSYEELRFAHDNDLQILPLRVCDDPWPPKPPSGPNHQYDKMGAGEGLLMLAIGRSTVYVDCRGKDEIYIAARIAETLLPGGPRRPSHGKGVSPGPSSAAGYSQQDTKGASPDISPSSAGYSGHQESGGKLRRVAWAIQ